MNDTLVGHRRFVDGVLRAVRLDAAGKQYVLDGDGNRVPGVWVCPPEVPSDHAPEDHFQEEQARG